MRLNLYLIELHAARLVATPLSAHEAAQSFDGGQTLMLGRRVDLLQLASRQKRTLEVRPAALTANNPLAHVHELIPRVRSLAS